MDSLGSASGCREENVLHSSYRKVEVEFHQTHSCCCTGAHHTLPADLHAERVNPSMLDGFPRGERAARFSRRRSGSPCNPMDPPDDASSRWVWAEQGRGSFEGRARRVQPQHDTRADAVQPLNPYLDCPRACRSVAPPLYPRRHRRRADSATRATRQPTAVKPDSTTCVGWLCPYHDQPCHGAGPVQAVTPATAATRSRTNGGCVGAVGGTHLILVFWRCCKGFAVPPHYRPSMPRRRVGNPEPMQHTQRVAGRAGSTPSTPAPLAGPTTRAARRHRNETEEPPLQRPRPQST